MNKETLLSCMITKEELGETYLEEFKVNEMTGRNWFCRWRVNFWFLEKGSFFLLDWKEWITFFFPKIIFEFVFHNFLKEWIRRDFSNFFFLKLFKKVVFEKSEKEERKKFFFLFISLSRKRSQFLLLHFFNLNALAFWNQVF